MIVVILLKTFIRFGFCLKLIGTPNKLYYGLDNDGRAAIFASLDLSNHQSTITNMASLLSCKFIPTDGYYGLYKEGDSGGGGEGGGGYPNENFKKFVKNLIDNVFGIKEFHPYYFPFPYLESNPYLRQAILSRVSEFNPGIVKLHSRAQQILGDKELKSILLNVAKNPALIGNDQVGRWSWRLMVDYKCDLDDTIILERIKAKIASGCQAESLLLSNLTLIGAKAIEYFDGNFISKNVLESIERLRNADTLLFGYKELLCIIIERTIGEATSRRALWHGRLLFGTIITHPLMVEELQNLFIEYFGTYNFDQIPLYLAEKLIDQFRDNGKLHFPSQLSKDHYDALYGIDNYYPLRGGFWGGIDRYAHRFALSQLGGQLFLPPLTPCTMRDVITFLNLKEIRHGSQILFDQSHFVRPFLLLLKGDQQQQQQRHSEIIHCYDIVCTLKVMSLMMTVESGYFLKGSNGLEISSTPPPNSSTHQFRENFWLAFSKLILYNLIFRGTIGFDLSENFWRGIWNVSKLIAIVKPTENNFPSQKSTLIIAGQLLALDFTTYFPLEVILENRTTRVIESSK